MEATTHKFTFEATSYLSNVFALCSSFVEILVGTVEIVQTTKTPVQQIFGRLRVSHVVTQQIGQF